MHPKMRKCEMLGYPVINYNAENSWVAVSFKRTNMVARKIA